MAEVHCTVADEGRVADRFFLTERRRVYTTPKSFLELISFYKEYLSKKRANLDKDTLRISRGISTIASAHHNVELLKGDLDSTIKQVGVKDQDTNALMQKLAIDAKSMEEQQAVAAIERGKAKIKFEEAAVLKEATDKELAAAQPGLLEAQAAVAGLSKQDLDELKRYDKPVEPIRMVIKAVMTLLAPNSKSDPITARNTVMKNPNLFKQTLEQYAKDNATKLEEKILSKLEPILAKPYFTADGMQASGSKAAASLCRWVVNLVKYYRVYKAVEPKIIEQQQAADQFKEANDKVDALNKKVEAMVAKVNAVKGNLSHAEMSSAQIKDEAKRLEKRMSLALRLVNGLDDHQKRWTKDLALYREQARTMVGDVLLAAAFVSYVGPFNAKYRQQLWRHTWIPDLIARRIPLADKFNTTDKCEDPLSLLATDSDFAMWKNDGLAADLVSLQNGAILTQCARWPLMIDPQLQGITWVKRKLEKEAELRAKEASAGGPDSKVSKSSSGGFRVIAPHSKNWLDVIIRGVQNGETIVLEGIGEEIDAFLDPVLSRATMQKGSERYIRVGHEEVLYNEKFRLILQTKLSNPHYKPEIAAQCTIINFIVTEEGLEENLLAMVVNREKADVEEKKSALARSINNFTVSLQVFENSILQRLNDAPADILGEESLIISLEETKDKAKVIAEKVNEARNAEKVINRNRDEYRMVAAEASWLYFLLNSLHNIDHMYQYSLDAFTNFFLKAMKKTPAAPITEQRVQLLRENIRYTIFAWVNRGLFGQHRLIFMGKLVFKLLQKNVLKEKFNAQHYDFLLHGIKNWKRPGELPKSKIDWLPKTAWEALNRLVGIEPFGKLLPDIEASPNRFKEWYNKNRPELAALPLEWRNKDDKEPFQKLMIVRALRPDRMTAALEHYVNIVLPNGKSYTECDAGKSFQDVLRMSLEDSTPHTPIFFILSPGSDPTKTVEVLAKNKFGDLAGKYHRIALGEGQDVVALATLDVAHREGHWVVLENIHLMPAWTFELEKKLDEFTGDKTHDDFRVFLSAEPSDLLPIGLLERSIKLTNEPPSGLKPNLKRAFATLLEKDPKNPDVADFEFKDPKAKMILFGLCHFHAIIIERIRYGTKGWNRVYPFNTGDLQNCNTVLSNYFDGGNDKIPWKDLQYIFGEILYGGHITDKNDRLLCMTYLDHFLKDSMLDEMELFPFNDSFPEERFRAPPVLTPAGYIQYIDENLLGESPVAFGMHPNAEIAVRTAQCENLFRTIIDLEPRSSGSDSSASHTSVEASNKEIVAKILEDVKSYQFDLAGIIAKMGDERGPYENVFLLECERMNVLAAEISRSCKELEAGAAGELQFSESMEKLQNSLALSRVPERWAELAYPSMRSLWSWFDDLAKRHMQLSNWSDEPTTIPMVTGLNFLFNPQSFLTAIMQTNAQKTHSELDKLVIQTDVKGKYEVADHARDGAYITGLFVEGARWNVSSGQLEECGPRDINYPMPIINCRAIPREKEEKNGVFRCPVYRTTRRGPTFVFTATLRTPQKYPPAKWILAGVCLLMETDE